MAAKASMPDIIEFYTYIRQYLLYEVYRSPRNALRAAIVAAGFSSISQWPESGITLVRTFTATAFANAGMTGANDFSPPIANTGIRRGVFANVASALASASKSLKYVKPTRMVPDCA
jgi:hypothetical protein